MNPFHRFGIQKTSPTFINEYINSPGLCFLKYVAGIRDSGNPKMWRGLAVEQGVTHLWNGRSIREAFDVAGSAFDQLVKKNLSLEMSSSQEVVDQRRLIGPMLQMAAQWQPPHRPNATQIHVEAFLPGVDFVQTHGYLDFSFNEIDVDLKTSERITNKLEPGDHARQASFYRLARDKRGGLLYITDKKQTFLEVSDELRDYSINQMVEALKACANFLSRMENPKDVIRSVHIDWDNWRAPKNPMTLEQIVAKMESGDVVDASSGAGF
jgi:hypothetical protein